MLVGWMVIHLLFYPIYSFFLLIYSFWFMDDFSWGDTPVVVGEGKKVIIPEEEKFVESMIPIKKLSNDEAEAWEHGSHRSDVYSFTFISKIGEAERCEEDPASGSSSSWRWNCSRNERREK